MGNPGEPRKILAQAGQEIAAQAEQGDYPVERTQTMHLRLARMHKTTSEQSVRRTKVSTESSQNLPVQRQLRLTCLLTEVLSPPYLARRSIGGLFYANWAPDTPIA
jgi:hypothetical protein